MFGSVLDVAVTNTFVPPPQRDARTHDSGAVTPQRSDLRLRSRDSTTLGPLTPESRLHNARTPDSRVVTPEPYSWGLTPVPTYIAVTSVEFFTS